jgi:sugar-specific transcriptional regulator TrmB
MRLFLALIKGKIRVLIKNNNMKNNKQIEILTKIGFTVKEAKVYITLLEYGDQSAGLISKKSNVNRATCYQILEHLKLKGVVSSYKKRDILFFHADEEDGLMNFLVNEKDKVNQKLNYLIENMEDIKALVGQLGLKPKVEFYEGLEGIKKVYLDTIKNNNKNEILAFFGKDFYTSDLKDFITNIYLPRRLKSKVKVKAVIESDIFLDNDENELRERMSYNVKESIEIEINIYNDKVAFISYSNNQYIAVVIQDTKICNALRGIHELIWNLLSTQNSINTIAGKNV